MSKKKELVGEAVPNQQALREELLGRFSREDMGLKNREISVMTRMSPYIVEVLDALDSPGLSVAILLSLE